MDWFSYLSAGLMVYVSVVVLVLGLGYRLYRWRQFPVTPVQQGLFPKGGTSGAKWVKVAQDSLVFPQVRDVDPRMWVFTVLFHLSLLGAFIGHLRLIREFTPLVNILGSEWMDTFAAWSGGIVGVILLVTLVYFLIRRFKSPFKDISTPEDYLLLGLLLLVVLMGNHLRFFGDVHMSDYQAYVQSLLNLDPTFTSTLDSSSSKWSLVLHVLFASLFFIWLPFSKLVHLIGTFATNLTRGK